jgi:hypothetical protein
MEEQWKQLSENPNYYISNLGRFKNSKGRIMKLNQNARGYLYCNILAKSVCSKVKIHRLVARYFVVNPYNKETVNHIDGNKLNNICSNLEWLTRKENIQHGYKNNLMWNKKNANP